MMGIMSTFCRLLIILCIHYVLGKHIVIVTICTSHFYLTETISRGLVTRGHQVTYIVSGECAERVHKTGAAIYNVKPWNFKNTMLVNRDGHLLECAHFGAEQLNQLIRDKEFPYPDFVMADLFVVGISAIAEKNNIPYANLYFAMADFPGITNKCSSLNSWFGIDDNFSSIHLYFSRSLLNFGLDFMLSAICRGANAIRTRNGLKDKFTSISHLLNSYPSFVMLNSKFQISFEGENIYPLGIIEVPYSSTVLPEDVQNFIETSDKDILYVAFGSKMNASDEMHYQLMTYLKEQTLYNVIYARYPGNAGAIFDNILVTDFIPQRELLQNPKVKLFISHCGLNSVIESIVAEVVTVCMPLGRDQHSSAFGLVNAGVATVVKNCESKESIINAVENATKMYTIIQENLIREKQRLYRMDGITQIENMISKFAGRTTRIYVTDPHTFGQKLVLISTLLTLIVLFILKTCFIMKIIKIILFQCKGRKCAVNKEKVN